VQLTKTPAELPAAAVELNKTPAVEPNEVQPPTASVEPNKMSPAPASSTEPDKAPAVEPNEVQPAAVAVEPNKMSRARDTTFEPEKPPTAELNEVQPAASAGEPNTISPAPAPTVELRRLLPLTTRRAPLVLLQQTEEGAALLEQCRRRFFADGFIYCMHSSGAIVGLCKILQGNIRGGNNWEPPHSATIIGVASTSLLHHSAAERRADYQARAR
jgi:hypothetical protein